MHNQEQREVIGHINEKVILKEQFVIQYRGKVLER